MNWNRTALTSAYGAAEASVPEPSTAIPNCVAASFLRFTGWRRKMTEKR